MSVTAEQYSRLEERVDEVTTKADNLQGSYKHLATKDDVSKAILKIVLWVVGIGIPAWIGLGIQILGGGK